MIRNLSLAHEAGRRRSTLPTPLQRASFGGAAKRPSETPHGATATIEESPFFFVGALV